MAFDIDVRKRLGSGTQVSLAFKSGPGLTALSGPSGVGKSTILAMVAGLIRPDAGHIRVAGRDLFSDGIDLAPERRHCGFIFQDARLFPHYRVRGNLLYGMSRHRSTLAEQRAMSFERIIEFLGIGHLLDRWPSTLSGGEAQRVAMGRALLSGPAFLLMDEPLSALDISRRSEIMVLIEDLRDRMGLPILYVSHDRAEIDRLASSVVDMGNVSPGPRHA